MKLKSVSGVLTFALVCCGCSSLSVQRYTSTNENGDNPTKIRRFGKGFEFPRPEPYLLVKRTEADKKITDVQVVYLADWTHTTVVKQRPFIGSSELGFTLNGPMLASFNTKQDSKTEALLTGASGLATGLGGLATGIGGAAGQIGTAITNGTTFLTTLDGIISKYLGVPGGVRAAMMVPGGAGAPPYPPVWVDTKEEKAVFAPLDDARSNFHAITGALVAGSQLSDAQKLATTFDELVSDRLPLVCFTCSDELRVLRRRVLELHGAANSKLPIGKLAGTPGGGADGIRNAIEGNFGDAIKAIEAAIGLLDLQQLGPFELYRITPTGLQAVTIKP